MKQTTPKQESIEDLYPGSPYLSAADVTVGHNLAAKITAVEVVKMPRSGDKRIVLVLEGQEKKFALNKTNALACAGKFGDDYNAWPDSEIEIANVQTTFGNSAVRGLRVVV